MKKIFLYFSYLMLTSILFFSCEKKEEVISIAPNNPVTPQDTSTLATDCGTKFWRLTPAPLSATGYVRVLKTGKLKMLVKANSSDTAKLTLSQDAIDWNFDGDFDVALNFTNFTGTNGGYAIAGVFAQADSGYYIYLNSSYIRVTTPDTSIIKSVTTTSSGNFRLKRVGQMLTISGASGDVDISWQQSAVPIGLRYYMEVGIAPGGSDKQTTIYIEDVKVTGMGLTADNFDCNSIINPL